MNSQKISVVIGPLNLKETLGKLEFGMANPGIGGTEFQLLSLALSLNRENFVRDRYWSFRLNNG